MKAFLFLFLCLALSTSALAQRQDGPGPDALSDYMKGTWVLEDSTKYEFSDSKVQIWRKNKKVGTFTFEAFWVAADTISLKIKRVGKTLVVPKSPTEATFGKKAGKKR